MGEIDMHRVRDARRQNYVTLLWAVTTEEAGQLVDGGHDGRDLQWENPRW